MITQLLAATMGIIAAWQTLFCLQCVKTGDTHAHTHLHRKTDIYEPEHTEAPSLIIKQVLVMGRPVLVCCGSLTSGRRNIKHSNLVKQTMQNANVKVLFEGGLLR